MVDWKDLEDRLMRDLKLDRPPVTISFCDTTPAGVRRFDGSVPSGCTFWKLAATAPAGQSAFYTVAADHQNCPIGAHTHNIPHTDGGAMLNEMLGMMAGIGYVRLEEVPQIPQWSRTPAAVLYARLGEAPLPPDVVIFACGAAAAMLLSEAARSAAVHSSLPPLPRPTCMAVPAAAAHGATMSLGCIGNRIYTDVADDHIYLMIRGSDLIKVADALSGIIAANRQLTMFHQARRPELTKGDAIRK
jgi:uncharacterized protein (DUF169 family)